MKTRPRITYETRSTRARRQALMRLGVWIFLGIFAFSVVGGLMIFVAH